VTPCKVFFPDLRQKVQLQVLLKNVELDYVCAWIGCWEPKLQHIPATLLWAPLPALWASSWPCVLFNWVCAMSFLNGVQAVWV